MNYLISIRDKDIFPNQQLKVIESWEDRLTVKIVAQNKEGKIALVTNPVHKQYLLPGGGVGQGESISEAAEREAREEIGYVIINQKVIGQTEEYRAREGRHYLTTAILAQVGEAVNEDLRTDEEKNVGLQVVWFSPKEVSTIFKRQVKSVHEGKINFYNTAFNIVRNKVLFEEAQKMYKIGLD